MNNKLQIIFENLCDYYYLIKISFVYNSRILNSSIKLDFFKYFRCPIKYWKKWKYN